MVAADAVGVGKVGGGEVAETLAAVGEGDGDERLALGGGQTGEFGHVVAEDAGGAGLEGAAVDEDEDGQGRAIDGVAVRSPDVDRQAVGLALSDV
jgi:hypothetical protein